MAPVHSFTNGRETRALVGSGGGAADCGLNNCTVAGNSAGEIGGGVSRCLAPDSVLNKLTNCIVYFNSAPAEANYSHSVLNYSCTTPMPANGVGNITNAPLFVDYAAGNLRLQSNSPCINAGSNSHVPAV